MSDAKVTGEKVVEMLQCLGEGESARVDGIEWTNIGDKFAVEADEDGTPVADGEDLVYVGFDDLDDYFDGEAEYEVSP